MSVNQPLMARVNRRFEALPQRVFDAWLDAKTVGIWLTATEQKVAPGKLVGVQIEPRVGGAFRFTYQRNGDEFEQSGTYLEIDRPRRLAFSWAMPSFTPHIGRVTIDFESAVAGSEVTLTHEMDPTWSPDHVQGAETGWTQVLEAMADALAAPEPSA